MKSVKIVIGGYYGCGNIGDDALLVGLLSGLGDTPVVPVVLSGDPQETQTNFGIPTIQRRDWNAIKKELDTADALVLGGGGLLQDVTSLFSVQYYSKLIHTARRMGKRVILLGQGIGPLSSFMGRRAAASALKAAHVVAVRDPQSVRTIRSLGVKRPVEVTADLAWLVEPDRTAQGGFGIGGMKSVGIAARPLRRNKDLPKLFGGFVQLLFQNQYMPVLVEMDRKVDTALLDAVAKMHGGRCPDLRNVGTPAQMVGRIARMHAVVAMRLHGGLFAALSGTAPMMLAYDPKISAFASQMELPAPLKLEGLTPQRLWDAFKRFEMERKRLDALVALRRDQQVKAAQRNIDIMKESIPALAETLT